MKNSILFLIFFATTSQLFSQSTPGKNYKPNVFDTSYHHTKFGIEPVDLLFEFAAYTCSFDSEDDNNGDGKSDLWGIPEWVAFEVKKSTTNNEVEYDRPSVWMTSDSLNKIGIAPTDATYAVSGTNDLKEIKTDYRFVRGHMCPKDAADRISNDAGYNTHTVLNAVPQLQWQNNGIWKKLEEETTEWADKYGSVWVVCGPIFFDKVPAIWLGQENEMKIAVPDALYKIVIREKGSTKEILGFVIPNILPKDKKDFSQYLTDVNRIEELTGIDFLTELSDEVQKQLENKHQGLTDEKKKAAVEKW